MDLTVSSLASDSIVFGLDNFGYGFYYLPLNWIFYFLLVMCLLDLTMPLVGSNYLPLHWIFNSSNMFTGFDVDWKFVCWT